MNTLSPPLWLPALLLLCGPLHALELGTCTTKTGGIHRWITQPATLAPWQRTVLVARITGSIRALHVDLGDQVKAGDVLIELEVPEWEAQLIKAEAELVASSQDLERLTQTRAKSPDLILPQELENARARQAAANAQLKALQAQLEFAKIKAPFNGVITRRMVDLGALAAAQTTQLLEVSQLDPLRLCIPVPELEAGRATLGKPVRIIGDAGLPWVGEPEYKISRSAQQLDSETRTLLVQADVPNPGLKRLPGSYVLAQVAVEYHEGVTLAPQAALIMEKTQGVVFAHEQGKARRVPVKLGFQDGSAVELPELPAGKVLLLPEGKALVDGAEVNLKP